MLNDQNDVGKNFANSFTTNTWQDRNGFDHTNLAVRINVNDENLKRALIEKAKNIVEFNVTFNDKKTTPILKDIEAIEYAVIEYIAMCMKGSFILKEEIRAEVRNISSCIWKKIARAK